MASYLTSTETASAAVICSSGKISRQDSLLYQSFDKAKCTSTTVAGDLDGNVLVIAHKKCLGSNCSCQIVCATFFLPPPDGCLTFDPAVRFTHSVDMEPPYLLVVASHGTIISFVSLDSREIHRSSHPPGCYSLSTEDLRLQPAIELQRFDEVCRIAESWKRDTLRARVAVESVAAHLGSAQVIAVLSKTNNPVNMTAIGFKMKPWKPRGYVSDYNFFTQRYRALVLSKQPGTTNSLINAALGKIWRNLRKEDKRRFEDMAERDKIRYWQEVELFNSRTEGQKVVPRINTPVEFQGTSLSRRMSSSYNLFAHQEKQFLFGLGRPDLNKKIGLFVGHRWRTMDPDELALYALLEQYDGSDITHTYPASAAAASSAGAGAGAGAGASSRFPATFRARETETPVFKRKLIDLRASEDTYSKRNESAHFSKVIRRAYDERRRLEEYQRNDANEEEEKEEEEEDGDTNSAEDSDDYEGEVNCGEEEEEEEE